MDFHAQDDGGAPLIDINTTPLIDVMLVLLIMLIVTIPVPVQMIGMETPMPGNPPAKPNPAIHVALSAAGDLTWDGTPLDGYPALRQRLAEAAPRQPDIRIHVDGGRPYREMVAILAACQQTGLTNVAIVDKTAIRPPG